ncbi:hypothetical protein ACFXJ8_24515 [Nonomuraea sp. NPDC059194]|uniref:hypothetical protein n=1 Tax=Nonomuraea sp. NPDC059194 TaxID=3346764 RepID=UPI00369AAC2E
MEQNSTVRTIDNQLINLEIDGVEPDELHTWTGHIRYTPRYGGRETTSDVWALELAPKSALGVAVSSVGGKERERFALAGGELVIYDCENPSDARWAAWLGPWNMAHGLFYAPQWESGDIVATFTRLQWTDTPEGLIATPGRRFHLQQAVYLQTVAGVGTLQVEPKRQAASQVPHFRGYSAPAGEVWRVPSGEGPEHETLLMVTDTAVIRVSPWDAPRKGLQAANGVATRSGGGTPEAAAEFLTKVKRASYGA